MTVPPLTAFQEIADRVFVAVEPLIQVNVTLVVGDGRALLVDTLSTDEQARELLAAVRRITDAALTIVNTHHHFDHAFGNDAIAGATGAEIWANEATARLLREVGHELRREAHEEYLAEQPVFAQALQRVRIRPPDRTFHQASTLDIGGRRVELSHLGRGHSEGDVIVEVPDAAILIAGDLVEEGSAPGFGDAYPIAWPDTLAGLRDRLAPDTQVVPGHGRVVDREFVSAQHDELTAVAWLIRDAHADHVDMEKVARSMPLCRWGDYGLAQARSAVARGYQELNASL
jgi:glyoxylase-like metal-dependent hydrolase (beta-lactamase superfamily II)